MGTPSGVAHLAAGPSRRTAIPLAIRRADGVLSVLPHSREDTGSLRECTRILGLEGFRVERIEWEGDRSNAGVCGFPLPLKSGRGNYCAGSRQRLTVVRWWRFATLTREGAVQGVAGAEGLVLPP